MSDLRTAVEKTIKDYVAAKADQKLCVHDLFVLFANCCDVAKASVQGIGGDDTKFNELCNDFEDGVRTYFRPLDIPGVGEAIEDFIDRQIIAAVRPTMRLLRPAPHANH